jgi:SSS family solute:Na+ symporter
MTWIDWAIVAATLLGASGIGLWFTKRASKSAEDFFVGGRSVPWWLAGTSILSTSFASDTPLHTTRMIREQGLAGAWFYWNGILSMIVIAFFFSRLWRRTGVVTDNEFLELRYTGKRAAVLRGGMAVYKTVLLEMLTLAWITLGMTKIVKVIMDLPDTVSLPLLGAVPAEAVVVAVLMAVTVVYSSASGIWGVVTADTLEFTIAMAGAIVLAVISLDRVGGAEGLRAGLAKTHLGEGALDLVPDFGSEDLTFITLGVWVGVQWWANTGVDGSGHRAQRFLSSKDEGHALASGIWSLAVQWLIRSWPWYIAALASLVLYPDVADGESVYPLMVRDLLPVGLKGLMVASFISAFVGTVTSHYNLTASYMVNDVYRRFVRKDRDAKHYVRASRVSTVAVAAASGVLALLLPSVLGAFRFKMELMAGLGLVYALRWFWWRVNATTEIVALVASLVTALSLNYWKFGGNDAEGSAVRLLTVVVVSGVAAVGTALFTAPEPREHLLAFYRRVRPPGAWGPIAEEVGRVDVNAEASGFGWPTFFQMALALLFVFAGMIGIGKLILGSPLLGLALLAVGVAACATLLRWVFGKQPA